MKVENGTRRSFLRFGAEAAGALAAGAVIGGIGPAEAFGQPGTRLKLLNPRNRIPLSFIIDDSTCLVNMGHFCMPQFAAAWPERKIYEKPWKTWPREIPDSFVRTFGEWCSEHGVRGKYSIVPYPACVGWLDRELPGWSRTDLQASLKLVRELMLPNWDIHPEMITHTRVIDTKTGRPLEEISSATMENSYPQTKKSPDELAEYLSYALRILRNCDLPCEGITTPGGFGSLVQSELSLAVRQAVQDVYRVEIPHYFKYVSEGDETTFPKLEHLSRENTPNPEFTVNVPAGTGDWFGGWDGDEVPEPDRYIGPDGTSGRLPELIEKGQPGIFLCHWPGMYCNGSLRGFEAFQAVVTRLNQGFGVRTVWMKVSEIARYWAARELTRIELGGESATLHAPFACPGFTVQLTRPETGPPEVRTGQEVLPLREVSRMDQLEPGTWFREERETSICFDLPIGKSVLRLTRA